jgi:hypothetical protein
LFQGLEHEASDPGQLYFEPSGNVYNPQLQRDLSLIGPQGIFGPPSGFGNGGFSSASGHGSSAGGPSNLAGALSDLAVVGNAITSTESLNSPDAWFGFGGSEFGIKLPIPLLGNLLCFINCDSSNGDQPNHPPHETSQTYLNLGIPLIHGQRSAAGEIVPVGILVPFDIPEDPSDPNFHPGPGWKLGKNGKTWKNDSLRQKLKADPEHEPPIGPHFDWQSTKKPKMKLRIRRRGFGIEYWNKNLGEGDWELLEPLGWFLE